MRKKAMLDKNYYHFSDNEETSIYFHVDWETKNVMQNIVSMPKKRGRAFKRGLFAIKFSTFYSNYHWYFGREKTLYGKNRLKVTTENQWLQSLNKTI